MSILGLAVFKICRQEIREAFTINKAKMLATSSCINSDNFNLANDNLFLARSPTGRMRYNKTSLAAKAFMNLQQTTS